MNIQKLRRIAQQLYDEHRPDVCMIEKKASGQSLIQDMRRAGLPVLEYLPDRDKVARVYATPIMEAGRVWILLLYEAGDQVEYGYLYERMALRNKKWSERFIRRTITFSKCSS